MKSILIEDYRINVSFCNFESSSPKLANMRQFGRHYLTKPLEEEALYRRNTLLIMGHIYLLIPFFLKGHLSF